MTTNRITKKQKQALEAIALYGDVAGKHETIAEATYRSLKARGLIIIDHVSIRTSSAGTALLADMFARKTFARCYRDVVRAQKNAAVSQ